MQLLYDSSRMGYGLLVNALTVAVNQAGITLGFGVEITVGWEGKEHHLLGSVDAAGGGCPYDSAHLPLVLHVMSSYFPDAMWRGVSLSPEMQALQVGLVDVTATCWMCHECGLVLLPCVLEQVVVAKVKKSREDRNDAMVAWLNEILWVRCRSAGFCGSCSHGCDGLFGSGSRTPIGVLHKCCR